jgi:hypothetical protein
MGLGGGPGEFERHGEYTQEIERDEGFESVFQYKL